jgi:GTPase Era involved in 16S rRNA processing
MLDLIFSINTLGTKLMKEINFKLILNPIHQSLNIQLEQVLKKTFHSKKKSIFLFNLVDTTRRRQKSTDKNPINSSTSSDDDKTSPPVEIFPFSFDSLQKLSDQNDPNNNQKLIELDHLYPSIDKNTIQIKTNDEDDDDDLLSAAARACTHIKTM